MATQEINEESWQSFASDGLKKIPYAAAAAAQNYEYDSTTETDTPSQSSDNVKNSSKVKNNLKFSQFHSSTSKQLTDSKDASLKQVYFGDESRFAKSNEEQPILIA